MGKYVPPLYGVENAVKIVNKISAIDEKINELLIQRESYVADLKKAVKNNDTAEA